MKYIRVFFNFARYGLIWVMEFRFNFACWAILGVMWSFLYIYLGELIFGQVTSIAGWTKAETLLVLATEAMFVGFLWLFIFPNLRMFSELIRKGKLDFYLLKPMSSRFLVSTQDWSLDQLVRIPAVIVFMVILINTNHLQITLSSISGFILLFLLGALIFYNIFFAITITNFWLVNVSNLSDFFHNVLDSGRFPTKIYNGLIYFIALYVIPVAFIATFPVQALLGNLEANMYLIAIFLAIITSIFSQWFWNFALKRYSSASS